MYKDADENIKRFRLELNDAEKYFDVINKQFIIEWITGMQPYSRETINHRKKRREKTTLILTSILEQKLGEEKKEEKRRGNTVKDK